MILYGIQHINAVANAHIQPERYQTIPVKIALITNPTECHNELSLFPFFHSITSPFHTAVKIITTIIAILIMFSIYYAFFLQ
jgi:hypothetical protein